jgi:peptide/nickel transport system ATP-binding protein
MSVVLEMKNLRIDARKGGTVWTPIVQEIDLILRRGEVLGLIGESGAGKSTIGVAALGYTLPGCRISNGSIIFDGIDLVTLLSEKRRKFRGSRIAYVPQSAAAALNPALTLNDQICEVPVRHGLMSAVKARSRAVHLYQRLQLPSPLSFGDRYPHQASGGQLQRASIAMAMMCKPDILVLDEPTTALDVMTQIEVLEMARHLIRDEGTAALYITHDLALVAQLADKIMVLRHGRIVEVGKTKEIIETPKTGYARMLVGAYKRPRKPDAARPSAQPLIDLRAVVARYRSGPAVVNNVSLSVGKGETVAVVGQSGSGKSSLARVIIGLLPQASGEIRFFDRPLPPKLRDREKEWLRRIQLINQSPDVSLNPRQSIHEAIGRPLELFFNVTGAAQRRRVSDLLTMVGLPEEFGRRSPRELSGGQKQRVCVARALAAEPDLIICDEVTSALDCLIAQDILKLLLDIQKLTHVGYLFITHDLGVVRQISDRVVVMHQGKIVEEGDLAKVFDRPSDEYTKLLLSSVPELQSGWLDQMVRRRISVA